MPDSPFLPSPQSDPAPQPPPLENEPEDRRLIRPWHLALIGLLVGYPLSVGPTIWLSRTLDPNQQHVEVLMWTFAPLEYLYRTVTPVRIFYDWYLPLFGVK